MNTRPTPQAAPPTPEPRFDVADDDYVSGAQLKRIIANLPRDNTGVELAASGNVGIARAQFAEDFRDYGPEIEAKLAQVPANLRTLDNIATVVKLVRSDHIDEIAHKRAQHLVSTMEPTLRSNGASGPPAPVNRDFSLDSEKISAEWKERAREAKITDQVVYDFCRANDMSIEAFYKQFDKPVSAIVGEHSIKKQGADSV